MSDLAPRRLILTLYGLYAREESNWLSVRSIVELMGHIGIDSAGTRSSISRLKRRGVLESVSVDGKPGYTLSDDALAVLRAGDSRIFESRRASVDDGFVLVVFSVPEAERAKRHQLRSSLGAMGFGTASPGVWIAPAPLRAEATRTLQRRELSEYVEIFHARHDGFGTLSERVAQWWDLPTVEAEYSAFIEAYASAAERMTGVDDKQRAAFEIYIPMLTQWRRLPYLDPGLPSELLPRQWNGHRAHELFHELDALLRAPAREHAVATIHR